MAFTVYLKVISISPVPKFQTRINLSDEPLIKNLLLYDICRKLITSVWPINFLTNFFEGTWNMQISCLEVEKNTC